MMCTTAIKIANANYKLFKDTDEKGSIFLLSFLKIVQVGVTTCIILGYICLSPAFL